MEVESDITVITGEIPNLFTKQTHILKAGLERKRDRLLPAKGCPVQVETERREPGALEVEETEQCCHPPGRVN